MSSSSLKKLHDDLKRWAASAQHTLLASDRLSADDIKSRLIALVTDSLRSAARKLDANENNAFVRLPPALLGRILGEPLDTFDIAAVSQSCRRLRLRMLDCPQYWNRRTLLMSGTNLMFERFIMQRSRPTPLDLSFCIDALVESAEWTETSCQLVRDAMDRLRRLSLVLERPVGVWRHDQWGRLYIAEDVATPDDEHRAARESWSLVKTILETPAPLLRELILARSAAGPGWQYDLPVDLFSGDAPLLIACTLKGVSLPEQRVNAFANLVSLHYHSFQPKLAELELTSFGWILDGLPLLESLILKGFWFSLDRAEVTPSISRLRSVRILEVPLPFEIPLGAAARHTDLPRVHYFFNQRGVWRFECTCFDGMPSVFTAPETLLRAYPRIESMVNLLPHIEFRSGPTTILVLREFWGLELFKTTPAVYAHLEHLTIHEYFWPKEGVLPAAPRLEALCIVLGSLLEFEVFDRAFGTQTCSLFQADGAWPCPALRALHLAYPPPSARRRSPSKRAVGSGDRDVDSMFTYSRASADTLPVSLRDIHHFVATCLRFARPRLAVLDLVGVEPVDPDAWELLYAVAEDVRISSTVDADLVDRIAWDWCMDS